MSWISDALDGETRVDALPPLTDPHAMHLIAANHNWDGDNEVLRLLSENPLLDKGTALLLFWQAEPPEVWMGLASDDETGEHELYDLIDQLRSRLLADDFVSRSIAVDLRDDLGYNRLFLERLRRADVAPALWQRSPGEQFDEAAVIHRLQARG